MGFGYQQGLVHPICELLWANKSHEILTVLQGLNSLLVASASPLQRCFLCAAHSVCASEFNILPF